MSYCVEISLAVDSTIFCSVTDLQQIWDIFSNKIHKLKAWFDFNRFSLNLNKTKLILCGKCNMKADIHLDIDNVQTERV